MSPWPLALPRSCWRPSWRDDRRRRLAVAVASAVFGVIGVAAAVGLWRQRTVAWPVAAVVQVVGTLAAIVAVTTGGAQAPTILGWRSWPEALSRSSLPTHVQRPRPERPGR